MKSPLSHTLQFEQVRAAYGSRPVLRDVSFGVPAGQVTALIGPNGAGKSTLLRAACGLVPLTGGQICLAGQPLSRLTQAQLARLVAVVPQARQLPAAFTVWETVLMGRTPYLNWLGQVSAQDEAIARQAMQRTDTLALAERLMGELSGGEQQRVLLARALAQSAPVLLFDEPTAHLDLQYQYGLLDLMRNLAHQSGHAALVVLHDLNLAARYADQLVLLVDGAVAAEGRPEDVLEGERLSGVYRTPLQVLRTGANGEVVILPA